MLHRLCWGCWRGRRHGGLTDCMQNPFVMSMCLRFARICVSGSWRLLFIVHCLELRLTSHKLDFILPTAVEQAFFICPLALNASLRQEAEATPQPEHPWLA